jgi:Ribonuclease G/E
MTSPGGIDRPQLKEYNPYTKEQRERIKDAWEMYKKDIGLDVDLCLRLAREGKSEDEITEAVNDHHRDVEKTLEAWHNLRGEILR